MTKKNNENGSLSTSKLFDLLEKNDSKNEAAHSEIKTEIYKSRSDLVNMMSDLRERLVKIETQPAHEQFQSRFCPNTKGIELMVKWVEKHEKWHDDFIKSLEDNQKKYIEKLESKEAERTKQIRTVFWTAVIAIITGAVGLFFDYITGIG